MILGLYAIRDRKSGSYEPSVQMFQTADVAKRWFYQLVQDSKDKQPNSPIVAFSEDFELWFIGSFDLELGLIVSDVTGERLIAVASDMLKEA